MLAPLVLEPIALAARSVHRIEDARGVKVSCVRGVTWITQENDGRDLILASGDAVITIGPGWRLPAAAGVSVRSIPERACA
jgi:hypothetical protein